MIETMTGNICLNAFTVAASAVAEAMSTSKKARRKEASAGPQDSMTDDRKNTAQAAEVDLPELVSMNLVRTDGGTQARMTINESVVKEYADALGEGAKLPPIVLYYDHDADVYWLADGFHRFEAHRMIGRVGISAFVKDGTRRDAKLHAIGANATHGLKRTNEDKRRAVEMMLEDPEWVQWSDREIAKACGVSHMLVATVRREHLEEMPDSPTAAATRTVARNGTIYEQKVKTKPAQAEVTPESSAALEADPVDLVSTIAVLHPSSDQGQVAVTDVDLNLRAENAQLKTDVAELLVEIEQLARVVEADDQLKAAWTEVTRQKALAEYAERTLTTRIHEFNERARDVSYWKNRAEKAEKLLANATTTSAARASSDENAQLHAQIADMSAELLRRDAQFKAQAFQNEDLAVQAKILVLQLEEAMACHDEMRAILETTVPLTETPYQLDQVLRLARGLEERVAEAPRRHDDAPCERPPIGQPTKDEVSVFCENFVELIEGPPFDCTSHIDDHMEMR